MKRRLLRLLFTCIPNCGEAYLVRHTGNDASLLPREKSDYKS